MKLYYTTPGQTTRIEVLDEAATVFIVNDEGHVLQVTDTRYAQHGQEGFNVYAGEGLLTIRPMSSNLVVLCPDRKGATGIPAKKSRRKK